MMKPGAIAAVVLVLSNSGAAVAQERIGATHLASLPLADTRALNGSERVSACDSDWDGAALGSAVGAAAGLGLTALANDGCHEGFCAVGAVLGAIAGLWGGLAIDSRGCDDRERAPATRDVWPSRP